MQAEQLRLVLVRDHADEGSIEALLEADGRRRVHEVDFEDLEPFLDDLAALDLPGLPDAGLVVATVLHRARRHPTRARELAEASRDAYETAGDQDGLVLATLLLGHLAFMRGDTTAAATWWDQAGGLPVEQAVPAGLAPFRAAADLLTQGHLSRAVPEARHAYAITVAEGSVVDEAHATLFSGLVAMDTGELGRSLETLQRADDLFAEISRPNDAALWPGVALGLGEIAARRGLVDEAMFQFETAARRADDLGRPALAAVAMAMPALHLSSQVDRDLLPAAEAASQAINDDEHHWFARQLIERAIASALLVAGDADGALEHAQATADTAANELLRAKSLLLVARARLDLDLGGVAEALDEAIATFLAEGAHLWAVEALLERAELDHEGASRLLEQAYAHTGFDPAFERLWQRRTRLVVELSGNRRPVFRVGSEVLSLGAKGELLTEVVVKAGHAGIHWETVAARLWPDEDDAERIKSRLTSLTSLVRGRLGPEGWRLRRDGPRFQFISLAADIVIVTDETAPMRALMSL